MSSVKTMKNFFDVIKNKKLIKTIEKIIGLLYILTKLNLLMEGFFIL